MRKSIWTAMNGDILRSGSVCDIQYINKIGMGWVDSTAICVLKDGNPPVFLESGQRKVYGFQSINVIGIHNPNGRDNYEEGEYSVTLPDGKVLAGELRHLGYNGWNLILRNFSLTDDPESPLILKFPKDCEGYVLDKKKDEQWEVELELEVEEEEVLDLAGKYLAFEGGGASSLSYVSFLLDPLYNSGVTVEDIIFIDAKDSSKEFWESRGCQFMTDEEFLNSNPSRSFTPQVLPTAEFTIQDAKFNLANFDDRATIDRVHDKSMFHEWLESFLMHEQDPKFRIPRRYGKGSGIVLRDTLSSGSKSLEILDLSKPKLDDGIRIATEYISGEEYVVDINIEKDMVYPRRVKEMRNGSDISYLLIGSNSVIYERLKYATLQAVKALKVEGFEVANFQYILSEDTNELYLIEASLRLSGSSKAWLEHKKINILRSTAMDERNLSSFDKFEIHH